MKLITDWQPIETCPEGVEVWTKIDFGISEYKVQTLVKRPSRPGKTRPMFRYPGSKMFIYYYPTHWRPCETEGEER